jgi:phosphohistidine phosphatase
MELYLIRHGLAGESGSYTNDAERPLTEAGRKKTRQVANRLIELGLTFDLILTSPLVRARQTAELLLQAGLSKTLEEANYLAPDGDITSWINWLATWNADEKGSLALVGHEPNLSAWAEILARGDAKGAIELKKAGAIGLSLPDNGTPIGRSRLFWLVPPRLLLK